MFYKKILLGGGVLLVSTTSVLAASLDLHPSTSNLVQGCPQTIEVQLSTDGDTTNGAQLYIDHDMDIAGGESLSIVSGGLFNSYGFPPGMGTGEVGIYGYGGDKTGNDMRFARVTIQSSTIGKVIHLNIRNDAGNPITSKIADASTSQNIMTSVTSGVYTVVTGYCETIPPSIIDLDPYNGQPDHPLADPIAFHIRDTGSKVDIATLQITVEQNGASVPFTVSYVQVIPGDDTEYAVVVTPDSPFIADMRVDWRVQVQDHAGNLRDTWYYFNDSGQPPIITNIVPPDNKPNHPSDGAITFNIEDDLGVDISTLSLVITQNGNNVPFDMSYFQVIPGDDRNYAVTINPDPSWISDVEVIWRVRVRDFMGRLADETHRFNNISCASMGCSAEPTECPDCPECTDTTTIVNTGGKYRDFWYYWEDLFGTGSVITEPEVIEKIVEVEVPGDCPEITLPSCPPQIVFGCEDITGMGRNLGFMHSLPDGITVDHDFFFYGTGAPETEVMLINSDKGSVMDNDLIDIHGLYAFGNFNKVFSGLYNFMVRGVDRDKLIRNVKIVDDKEMAENPDFTEFEGKEISAKKEPVSDNRYPRVTGKIDIRDQKIRPEDLVLVAVWQEPIMVANVEIDDDFGFETMPPSQIQDGEHTMTVFVHNKVKKEIAAETIKFRIGEVPKVVIEKERGTNWWWLLLVMFAIPIYVVTRYITSKHDYDPLWQQRIAIFVGLVAAALLLMLSIVIMLVWG